MLFLAEAAEAAAGASSVASWTIVLSVFATAAALLASAVGYMSLRANIDPSIVVFITMYTENRGVLALIVRNVGRGAAQDISFTTSAEVPVFRFEANPKTADQTLTSVLDRGLPSLAPGEERLYMLGMHPELEKTALGKGIRMEVTYHAPLYLLHPPRHFGLTTLLEIESFEATISSDTNHLKSIANSLKDIAKKR